MNNIQHDQTARVTEKTLNATGWGLFFIWIGIAFLANVGWGVGLLGVGLIMVGSQAARAFNGLSVERFGMLLGTCLAVAGAFHALGIRLDTTPIAPWIIPTLLIVAGAAILLSAFRRRSGG
jgi:hypothetical protein